MPLFAGLNSKIATIQKCASGYRNLTILGCVLNQANQTMVQAR